MTSTTAGNDHEAPSRTVVLVDEHGMRRESLAEALEDLGWCVLELAPEDDALEQLRSSPPDVVIAEVGGASGAASVLARRLRLHPETATLALVGTSATSVPGLGLLALFDLFLPAPLDPREVDTTLRALVPRSR